MFIKLVAVCTVFSQLMVTVTVSSFKTKRTDLQIFLKEIMGFKIIFMTNEMKKNAFLYVFHCIFFKNLEI